MRQGLVPGRRHGPSISGEIKRRTDVVSFFPNDEAIVRVVSASLLEQNDE